MFFLTNEYLGLYLFSYYEELLYYINAYIYQHTCQSHVDVDLFNDLEHVLHKYRLLPYL